MIKLHVLFADGDADTCEIFASSLQRDPFFVVRSCASGAEALRSARQWRPDLLLLDVKMPGLDGPSVFARLRTDRRTAAIPVVFVTARGQGQQCSHFRALGAVAVMEKPFDAAALAGELRRFVPIEGTLRPVRDNFLQRLDADARALLRCRQWLSRGASEPVLARVSKIAHALAGAGGIYGFASITCESAALSRAIEEFRAGRAKPGDVEQALDRLLRRIKPDQHSILDGHLCANVELAAATRRRRHEPVQPAP